MRHYSKNKQTKNQEKVWSSKADTKNKEIIAKAKWLRCGPFEGWK